MRLGYLEDMNWGIVCDPEQVDDAWPLIDAIRSAQGELLALT
jgi:hypothetical protein